MRIKALARIALFALILDYLIFTFITATINFTAWGLSYRIAFIVSLFIIFGITCAVIKEEFDGGDSW